VLNEIVQINTGDSSTYAGTSAPNLHAPAPNLHASAHLKRF